MRFLLLILLLLPMSVFSQVKYSLDNTLTGVYGTTSTGEQLTFGLNGTNSIEKNKFGFDFNPTYHLQYSPQLTNNEYLSRQNLRYNQEKYDLFITHVYNYSLIRGINSDNFIGVGGGIKREKKDKFKISVSYAILYQHTFYEDNLIKESFRHSVRTKIKITTNPVQLVTEYYFQPRVNNMNDIIINGTAQLVLFPKNKVNFTIQDLINYRSEGSFKMIHKVTFGVKFKITK